MKKQPKFPDLSRTGRPLRTLENLEVLLVACGIDHFRGDMDSSDWGWRMRFNNATHFDDGPVALAELTSLCRRHNFIAPTVTRSDVLALRGRKNVEEAAND